MLCYVFFVCLHIMLQYFRKKKISHSESFSVSYFITEIMLITLCSFCTSLPFTSKMVRVDPASLRSEMAESVEENVIFIITHYVPPLFFIWCHRRATYKRTKFVGNGDVTKIIQLSGKHFVQINE